MNFTDLSVPQLLDELPCEMIEMLISLSPQALDSHARRDYVAMDTVDLKISIETLNPTSEASNQVLEMTGQFSRSEPSHMGFFTSKPQKVSLIRYMAILAALVWIMLGTVLLLTMYRKRIRYNIQNLPLSPTQMVSQSYSLVVNDLRYHTHLTQQCLRR